MRVRILRFLPRACRTLAAALLCLPLAWAATAAPSPDELPRVRIGAGMHLITAEVAATDTARQRGLMFRESLAPNHGMLFVFDRPARQCFWMRNTPLPLSIAFVLDDGTIESLADMAPLSEQNHCSQQAVRYALEMEQGWFAQRGITVGQKLSLPQR